MSTATRSARRIALGALLAAAFVVVPATAASASAAARPLDLHAIDRIIEERLASEPIPGAAVAITAGKRIVHVKGFGHGSDGRPVTGATPFRIGSLAKSFTALAVMQLVEKRRLGLDDTVASRLPEFRIVDPRGADITVRELLDQTSGLADRLVPDRSRPQPRTLVEATRALRTARLVAAPGTEWNYHNPNYQVAARLVEVVSGEPYGRYLQRHVLAPAGMRHSTTTSTDADPVEGLPQGHVEAYGLGIPVAGPGDFIGGAGDVVSTAADMARWLVVHATDGSGPDGVGLVSRAGLHRLHEPSAPNGYAFGWATRGSAPAELHHSGSVQTYSAEMDILPGSQYGVVMLFNSASAYLAAQERVFSAVLHGIRGEPQRAAGLGLPPAAGDLLLGALSVSAIALGASGVARARRWADRRTTLLQRLLPSAPLVAVLVIAAELPVIGSGLMGGRDVTWRAVAYGWPALAALLVAAALAAAATLAARTVAIALARPWEPRRGVHGGHVDEPPLDPRGRQTADRTLRLDAVDGGGAAPVPRDGPRNPDGREPLTGLRRSRGRRRARARGSAPSNVGSPPHRRARPAAG